MISEPNSAVSFTGHRSYRGEADAQLRRTVEELYARGMRTFRTGMAVGFDLAAAEAVLVCRAVCPQIRLVAVVPFGGQAGRFSSADRARYDRVLAEADETVMLAERYYRGCYAVRNDFLVEHASAVVAWYDGSPGGTQYTVRRALVRGREVWNLHPSARAAGREVQGALF